MSRPVGGVLSTGPLRESGWVVIHLSGLPGDMRAGSPSHVLALLRVGFTEPAESPRSLVRSYRTVSPLPVRLSVPSAVYFLLHFPSGRPVWPLASTLPCGVPTFLDRLPDGPGRGHQTNSPP